jgi:thiosulfate dehydrogenase (quinone) large subunit
MHQPTKQPNEKRKRRWPYLADWAILPLRAFLGVTFLYAGLQKWTDPQFFDPTAPGFIGHQLARFATQSPLKWLLIEVAIPHATFFGGLIAFGEIWMGLATLLGLFARLSASVGALLNVLLWLSATWNVHPYFLGSDSIYAVAWLTLALTGTEAYSLDRWLRARRAQERSVVHAQRRALLRGAIAGGLVMGGGTILGFLGKLFASSGVLSSTSTTGEPAAPAGTPTPRSGGTAIASTSQLAVNSALTFILPSNGDPGVLVCLSETSYVAYDATCTHEGCPVDYDPEDKELICPCHGAMFDPARQGLVIDGPTNQPLAPLPLRIDGAGIIYVLDG